MEASENKQIIQIPYAVVSRVDVGRLIRELEALDNFLKAAETREPGASLQLPKTSKLLDETLQMNKLNALVPEDRERIISFLQSVRKEAPTVHMSFSADPSPLFAKRLVTWLRQNIHPLLLLQVGLQPTIGAGSVVRTTNKYFDFSLRNHLKENRETLIRQLKRVVEEPEAQTTDTTGSQESATPETASTAAEAKA